MSIKTIASISAIFTIISALPSITFATDNKEVSSIFVTATRTANTVDETLFPVTIISKDDIQRLQANSLTDILQMIPGISISSDGGAGSNSSINLRGTNSSHVLILIDGMPIHSATVGTTAIQFLPLAQIERIEVVRGSRSSLYGSEAIGGVVQIFTNKSNNDNFKANIGLGSNNTKDMGVDFTLADQSSMVTASISVTKTDGYNFLGYDSFGVKNTADSDNDGFKNYAFSLNARHHFNEDTQLSAMYMTSHGKSFFDSYADETTRLEFDEHAINIGLNTNINNWLKMSFKAGQTKDEQNNYLHRLGSSNAYFVDGFTSFKTTTDIFNWQNEIQLGDTSLMTLGFDFQLDNIDSTSNYSADSRDNKALYAQYIYYGEKIDTQFSLRHDDNEAFGGHTTWGANAGYGLSKKLRLTASIGTAFKAPTFNDLYWPADAFFKGNPDLKPEESITADIGLVYNTEKSAFTINYYQTQIEQLIAYVNAYPAVSMMENVDKAKIEGIELSMNTRLQNWLLQAQISANDPIDKKTNQTLSRRSKKNASFSLDYQSDNITYGASIILSSGRYNKINEQDYISGYGLLNLRTSWLINKHWTVKAKVNNALDRQYALSRDFYGNDYLQQERTAYISAHYTY